jgi:outer membrane protein assembly factor BamB
LSERQRNGFQSGIKERQAPVNRRVELRSYFSTHAVVIANDVVYALSDGDSPVQFGSNGDLLNTEQRKAAAAHSILYALDPQTGKFLFSSGDTIHSCSHFNAPVVAGICCDL